MKLPHPGELKGLGSPKVPKPKMPTARINETGTARMKFTRAMKTRRKFY